MDKCPKCGVEVEPGDMECQRCGVILAKARSAKGPIQATSHMMYCPVCNKRILKTASACPHCGTLNRTVKKNNTHSQNLINCKDCGKKVSRRAKNCPYCGAPVKPKQNSAQVGLVVTILFFGFIYIFNGFSSNKKPNNTKNIVNHNPERSIKISSRPVSQASSIVEIEQRHNTAEHPIKLQRITAMVDEESTIDNVIIRGKFGSKFYETDIYEKYNLFKFVVIYFWYYIDQDQVTITYQTNKNDYKKILVHRRAVERLTGDLNQVTRKRVGDIRYNKKLAKIIFSAYVRL